MRSSSGLRLGLAKADLLLGVDFRVETQSG